MTGVEIALLASALGSSVMGLFGGGSDQERQTFEREKRGGLSLDPRDMLAMATTAAGRHGDTLEEWMKSPVDLPGAYAQQPATYSGGGLPMPIGLTGRDPALDDPSKHLQLWGINSNDPFQGVGDMLYGPGGGGYSGDPGGDRPRPPGTPPEGKPVPRGPWSNPVQGRDLMGGGSDMDQAAAAFELLGIGGGSSPTAGLPSDYRGPGTKRPVARRSPG